MSDIDTTKETFQIRFHFYLTWLATQSEEKSYKEFEIEEKKEKDDYWIPKWTPDIDVTNFVDGSLDVLPWEYKIKTAFTNGMLKNSWKYKSDKDNSELDKYIKLIGFNPLEGVWIRCKYSGTLTCAEEFELRAFPFDIQGTSPPSK